MTFVDISTPIGRGTIASRYLEAISCAGGEGNDVSALSMSSPPTVPAHYGDFDRGEGAGPGTGIEKTTPTKHHGGSKLNDSSCALTAPTAPLDGSASWTTAATRATARSDRNTPSRRLSNNPSGGRNGSFRRNSSNHSNLNGSNHVPAVHNSKTTPEVELGIEDECSSIESSSSSRKAAHLSIDNEGGDDSGAIISSFGCSINNAAFMSNYGATQQSNRTKNSWRGTPSPGRGRKKSFSGGINDSSWISNRGIFPKTSPPSNSLKAQKERWANFRIQQQKQQQQQQLSAPYPMMKTTGHLHGSRGDGDKALSSSQHLNNDDATTEVLHNLSSKQNRRPSWGRSNSTKNSNRRFSGDESTALSEAGAATEVMTNRTTDLLSRHRPSPALQDPPAVRRRVWPPAKNGPPEPKSLMDDSTSIGTSTFDPQGPIDQKFATPALFDAMSASFSSRGTSSKLSAHMNKNYEDSFGLSTDQESSSMSLNTMHTMNTGSSSIRVETGAGAGSGTISNPDTSSKLTAAAAKFGVPKVESDGTPKRDGLRAAAMFGGRKKMFSQSGRAHPTARKLSRKLLTQSEPLSAASAGGGGGTTSPAPPPPPPPPQPQSHHLPEFQKSQQEEVEEEPHTPIRQKSDATVAAAAATTTTTTSSTESSNRSPRHNHEESSTTDDDTLYVSRRTGHQENGNTGTNFVVCNDRRQSNMDEVFHRRVTPDVTSGWTPISLSEKERMSDFSRGNEKSPIQPLFSLDRVDFSFDSTTCSPSRKVRSKSLSRMLEKKKEKHRQERKRVRSKSVAAPGRRYRNVVNDDKKKTADPAFCPEQPDPIICPESMSLSLSVPSANETFSPGSVDRSRSLSQSVPSADDVHSEKAVFSPSTRTANDHHNRVVKRSTTDGETSISHDTTIEEELVQIMDRSNERKKARSSKPPANSVAASEILHDLHRPRNAQSQNIASESSARTYRFRMGTESPSNFGESRLGDSRDEEFGAGSTKNKMRHFNNIQTQVDRSYNNDSQPRQRASQVSKDIEYCEENPRSVQQKIQAFSSRPPDQWNQKGARAEPSFSGDVRIPQEGERSQKNRIRVLGKHFDKMSRREDEKKDDEKSLDKSTIATRSLHGEEDDDDDRSVKSLRDKFERSFSPRNEIVENLNAIDNEYDHNDDGDDDDDRSVKSIRDLFEKQAMKEEEHHDDGYDGDEGSVRNIRKSFEPTPRKPANNLVSKLRAQFEANNGRSRLAPRVVDNRKSFASKLAPRYSTGGVGPAEIHPEESVPKSTHGLNNHDVMKSSNHALHPVLVAGPETKKTVSSKASLPRTNASKHEASHANLESKKNLMHSHSDVISQLRDVLEEKKFADSENTESHIQKAAPNKPGASSLDNGYSPSTRLHAAAIVKFPVANQRSWRDYETPPPTDMNRDQGQAHLESAASNKFSQGDTPGPIHAVPGDIGSFASLQGRYANETTSRRSINASFKRQVPTAASHNHTSAYPQASLTDQAPSNKSKHGGSFGPVSSPFFSVRDRLKVFSKSKFGSGFLDQEKNSNPPKRGGGHHPAKRQPLASQEKPGGLIDDADAEIGRAGSYDLSSVVSDDANDSPNFRSSLKLIEKNLGSSFEKIQKNRNTRESGQTITSQTQTKAVGGFFGRTNQEVRENQRKTELDKEATMKFSPAHKTDLSSEREEIKKDGPNDDRTGGLRVDANVADHRQNENQGKPFITENGSKGDVVADDASGKEPRQDGTNIDREALNNPSVFRMEGEFEGDVAVAKQKAPELKALQTPDRGATAAAYALPSNLKTAKSSESDFSDGVTLDVSVAEVSQLSNPSAIRTKESKDARDIDRQSSHSSTLEPMAKASEASSSQLSEAAAPLIGGDMRLNPMSDEMSDIKHRAVSEPDDPWDVVQDEDRKTSTPTQIFTPSGQTKNSIEQPDVEWDVQQVQSSFPFESSHSVDPFFIDPNSDDDPFQSSDWASFDQDDNGWISPKAVNQLTNSEALTRKSSHDIASNNTVRGMATNQRSIPTPSAPQTSQQIISPKLAVGSNNEAKHSTPHSSPRAVVASSMRNSKLNQRLAPTEPHTIIPTTTTSPVEPMAEMSNSILEPVRTASFFDKDYETIMESRHEMLMSRQRTHVQKRAAREVAKPSETKSPLEKARSARVPTADTQPQLSAGKYPSTSYLPSSRLQSNHHSAHGGGFFERTHPVRSQGQNEQHAISGVRSARASNELKPEPVFDLSASYSRYQAARNKSPVPTVSSTGASNRRPPAQESNKSYSFLGAQQDPQNLNKPASFYDRMATRLGFSSGGTSRQEALISRLRAVQASRIRRSRKRAGNPATTTATPATPNTVGQNHYLPTHTPRAHAASSIEHFSDDIASMLEVE